MSSKKPAPARLLFGANQKKHKKKVQEERDKLNPPSPRPVPVYWIQSGTEQLRVDNYSSDDEQPVSGNGLVPEDNASYCVCCKQRTGSSNSKPTTAKNGRRMIKSTCSSCGRGKCRFV